MSEPKQYASVYYARNREAKIAQQMEYHKKHRERYLEYMRSYNKLYWLMNKPPPKPKKEKVPKPPKPPREKKPPKEKKPRQRKPKEESWFVVPTPEYPMKMEKGNFILAFD
jgi:hypothetical protein